MRPALLVLISCGFAISAAARLGAQEGTVSPEVEALYEHARAAQAADKPAVAVADYRRILKLAPGLAQAYNNLGRLLYNLERYEEATTVLKGGLAIAPGMHGAEVMLGASYLELGQPANSISPLEAGVQAMPNDRFARVTLAHALIAADHPSEAVPQLEAVLKADPRDQEAWYILGKLHLQLSQQELSQVQTIDPNSPLAHELAGEVMESMENTPGAIAEYKQALAAKPEDLGAMEHLASVYWRTGDWPQARDGYQALLKRQPGNSLAHWRLSNALYELGDATADAMHEINLALDRPYPPPGARRAGTPPAAQWQPDGRAHRSQDRGKAAPDEPSVQRLLAQAYRTLGDRAKAEQANLRFQQLDSEQHAAKERHAASVVQANRWMIAEIFAGASFPETKGRSFEPLQPACMEGSGRRR